MDIRHFFHLHNDFTSTIILSQPKLLFCGERNLLELTPLNTTCHFSLSKNTSLRTGRQTNQQINSLQQILHKKLVKKSPAPYSTGIYIAVFTSPHHQSLHLASFSPSQPFYSFFFRSISILSYQLHHCLLPRFLHQQHVRISLPPCSFLIPRHIILLDLIAITIFKEEYKSWSESFQKFSISCHTFPLMPNIFLSILFSDISSLYYDPNVRDQMLKPYKLADNEYL